MSGDRASLLIPPSELRVFRSDSPCTARDALESVRGARAALDGVMFENCDPHGRPYASSSCGDPEYLLFDAARGLFEPSERPDRGGTVSVVGDSAVVLDGDAVARGASAAVQGYPTLVRRGVARGFGDDRSRQRVWRAGFGVARGMVLLAIADMSLGDFAAWGRSLGADDFFYTDGGGSGRLEWSDGRWVGAAENRRVPSFLLWQPSSDLRFGAAAAAAGLAIAAIGAVVAAFTEAPGGDGSYTGGPDR